MKKEVLIRMIFLAEQRLESLRKEIDFLNSPAGSPYKTEKRNSVYNSFLLEIKEKEDELAILNESLKVLF